MTHTLTCKMVLIGLVIGLLFGCSEAVEDGADALVQERRYTGELRSFKESYLTPPVVERVWQFKVARLMPEGTLVEQGQPVVWFDPSEPRRRLQERQSELQQRQQGIRDKALSLEQELQELNLDLAEARMNRDKAQLKASIDDPVMPEMERRIYQLDAQIAQERVNEIESQIEQRRTSSQAEEAQDLAEIDRLQRVVTSLANGVQQMVLTAPQSGILLYQTGFNGEKFSAGSDVYRALSVVSISDVNFVEVVVAIPERDLRYLDFDATVSVEIDSVDDRRWQGRVKNISNVYRSDGSVVYADIVVEVINPDPSTMRPGLKSMVVFQEARQ